MRPIVHDKRVKLRDPGLKCSREVSPVVVEGGIFDRFVNFDNYQAEVALDVISGLAIQYVGMDACVKFGDSKLKLSRRHFRPFFERR